MNFAIQWSWIYPHCKRAKIWKTFFYWQREKFLPQIRFHRISALGACFPTYVLNVHKVETLLKLFSGFLRSSGTDDYVLCQISLHIFSEKGLLSAHPPPQLVWTICLLTVLSSLRRGEGGGGFTLIQKGKKCSNGVLCHPVTPVKPRHPLVWQCYHGYLTSEGLNQTIWKWISQHVRIHW